MKKQLWDVERTRESAEREISCLQGKVESLKERLGAVCSHFPSDELLHQLDDEQDSGKSRVFFEGPFTIADVRWLREALDD